MSKRITIVVDDEVAAGLELLAGKSVSSTVNAVLREAIASARHRAAVLQWMDELDAELGPPSAAALAQADADLDELGVPRLDAASDAAA